MGVQEMYAGILAHSGTIANGNRTPRAARSVRKFTTRLLMRRNVAVSQPRREIEEIVSRETRAWDTQDADLLMTVFHPDMVWPWPRTPASHDPMDWELVLGRFDRDRWRAGWQALFDSHTLVHNRRQLRKIEISRERDGAFAVVDIDTLWRAPNGDVNHWKGRVCKVYTRVAGEWKLIMHTGVLDYPVMPVEADGRPGNG